MGGRVAREEERVGCSSVLWEDAGMKKRRGVSVAAETRAHCLTCTHTHCREPCVCGIQTYEKFGGKLMSLDS